MTTNQIKFAELKEAQRHNLETESQNKQKMVQDYDVGIRQASAAQSNAAAQHINAATRQAELDFSKQQYDEVGKGKVIADTGKVKSETALTDVKRDTELGASWSSQAKGTFDVQHYKDQKVLDNTTSIFSVLTLPMLKSGK